MSFILLGILETAKEALLDHAKSMPDTRMAEEEDFAIWGRKFAELLVSRHCGCFSIVDSTLFLGGIPKDLDRAKSDLASDEDVKAVLLEAVETFGSFKKPEWLSWGAEVMPVYAKTVADEAEAKCCQDEADRLEREAAAKKAVIQAWVEKWLGLVEQGTMKPEEFDRRIEALNNSEEVQSEEEKKPKRLIKSKKPFGTAVGGQESDKRKREEDFDGDRISSVPVSHLSELGLDSGAYSSVGA